MFRLVEILTPPDLEFATVASALKYPGKEITTYFGQKRTYVGPCNFPIAVLYRDVLTVPRLDVYSRLHISAFHANHKFLRQFCMFLQSNGFDDSKFRSTFGTDFSIKSLIFI